MNKKTKGRIEGKKEEMQYKKEVVRCLLNGI